MNPQNLRSVRALNTTERSPPESSRADRSDFLPLILALFERYQPFLSHDVDSRGMTLQDLFPGVKKGVTMPPSPVLLFVSEKRPSELPYQFSRRIMTSSGGVSQSRCLS
jgi:hypothetical protein